MDKTLQFNNRKIISEYYKIDYNTNPPTSYKLQRKFRRGEDESSVIPFGVLLVVEDAFVIETTFIQM